MLNYDAMGWNSLRKTASKLGIKTFRKNKTDLIKELNEKFPG